MEGLVLEDAVATVVGLVPLVVFLSEAFAKTLKVVFKVVLDGKKAWFATLGVSVVCSTLLAYFHVGLFSGADISSWGYYLTGPVVGLVVSLVANKTFDTPTAKAVLSFLKIRVPVTK
jgi:hypothetical protein